MFHLNQENRNHYLYKLKELGDDRGGMIVINPGIETPFTIRRLFYNYKTSPDAIRANHANSRSSFVMISLSGSCNVEVDEGNRVTEYRLDSPDKALFVGKGLWKIMKDYSDDNVLLILSDQEYDPKEYIRNYDDYINFLREQNQE